MSSYIWPAFFMISKNVKIYCAEDISKIENYDKAVVDLTLMWHVHHRRETIYTREGLIEIGEYWKRPAAELIFLPLHEHIAFHRKSIFKPDNKITVEYWEISKNSCKLNTSKYSFL